MKFSKEEENSQDLAACSLIAIYLNKYLTSSQPGYLMRSLKSKLFCMQKAFPP